MAGLGIRIRVSGPGLPAVQRPASAETAGACPGILAMVVWEVVKANVAIIRIVLSPHMEITPCLVPVKTDLKSAGARAALANAITLTPGTITVDVKDDVLWVHALTAEMAEGLKDWHVARQLARIEEIT